MEHRGRFQTLKLDRRSSVSTNHENEPARLCPVPAGMILALGVREVLLLLRVRADTHLSIPSPLPGTGEALTGRGGSFQSRHKVCIKCF